MQMKNYEILENFTNQLIELGYKGSVKLVDTVNGTNYYAMLYYREIDKEDHLVMLVNSGDYVYSDGREMVSNLVKRLEDSINQISFAFGIENGYRMIASRIECEKVIEAAKIALA